jgi:hypothetical protein
VHDSQRSTADKAGASDEEVADTLGMEAIDVLLDGNGLDHHLLVDVGGKGQLYEDPVDGIISIEGTDEGEELSLPYIFAKVIIYMGKP